MIADAGIEEDALVPGTWAVRVSFKDPANPRSSSATYRGSVSEGADASMLFQSLLKSGKIGPDIVTSDMERESLIGFAKDVVSAFGKDGFFVRPSGKDAIDALTGRLAERSFRECLESHRVADKLSYEQALIVVQEIYVVDPVMTS